MRPSSFFSRLLRNRGRQNLNLDAASIITVHYSSIHEHEQDPEPEDLRALILANSAVSHQFALVKQTSIIVVVVVRLQLSHSSIRRL